MKVIWELKEWEILALNFLECFVESFVFGATRAAYDTFFNNA